MNVGETSGCGEKLLDVHVVQVGVVEEHWQLIVLRPDDIRRTRYGQKFQLKRSNASGTMGWVAGEFTRESLTGLRDMLTRVPEGES